MNPSSKRKFQCHVRVSLTCPTEDTQSMHKEQWLVACSPQISCPGFQNHPHLHRSSTTHTNHRMTRKTCNCHYQGPENKEEKHICIACWEYSTKFVLENHSADVIFTTLRDVRTSHAYGEAYYWSHYNFFQNHLTVDGIVAAASMIS